MITIKN